MATKTGYRNVDELLEGVDHPDKAGVELARRIFLDASPEIQEGIKWNSMSFRTTEWFATWNWREQGQIQFVMHLGAKVRDANLVEQIKDPSGHLTWLAKNRALLNLGGAADISLKREAISSLFRNWILHV